MVKVILNKNEDFVKEVRQCIKDNDGYCCCSVLKSDIFRCPCKEFRDMVKNKEPGSCHCDLYEIVEGE